MKERDIPGLFRRRWGVCAAGAAAGLLLYACRAAHLPRRSSLGVEQRLFAIGDLPVKLLEAPDGGRWALTIQPPNSTPTVPGSAVLPALFADSRPLLAAGQEGTWLLEGSTLRRIWRYPARGWADESHLWAPSPASDQYPPDALLLDLHTGRTAEVRGRLGRKLAKEQEISTAPMAADDAFSEPLAEDQALRSTLATGAIAWYDADAGRVGLVAREDGTSPIYAVSNDAAPRSLLLSRRGVPVALSRDGRRLFFVRSAALWRLDLTQPLPTLLQRQPAAALPLPDELAAPGLTDRGVGQGGG